MTNRPRLLTWLVVLLAVVPACSRPGINAGRQGGVAFIVFAVMLVLMGAVLWFFLGRED